MCIYGTLIRNKKYTSNKKNGGDIPTVFDIRTLAVPIGCGKCYECMRSESREAKVRLHEELKHNKMKAHFVTLTFNPETYKELINKTKLIGYEADNYVCAIAMRRFNERYRKKYNKAIRHWAITELGGGRYEHVHIHAIMWHNGPSEEIEQIWNAEKVKYGYVYIGKVYEGITANYIVKYMTKVDPLHKAYTPKRLSSNGIGKGYINSLSAQKNKFNGEKTDENYILPTGHKIPLPKYYRNKIYTEEEKEQLWLQKLNKEKRYVFGTEINISTETGKKEYEKTLKYYQKINKELGYGKKATWKLKEYEKQRRILIQKERGKIIDDEPTKENLKQYNGTEDIWG